MATGKQAGKQPTPDTKAAAAAAPKKKGSNGNGKSEAAPAKTQVERMFGGVQQPKELHIDTSVPMPDYANPDFENMSAKDALDATDAILSALGTDKFEQTIVPVPKNRNNGPAAASFVLWDHIRRFAEKKAKEAEEIARNQGVFGDPDTYVPGETTIVFQTPGFVISIKQGHDSKMVNKENTMNVLQEVAPAKAFDLLERCMKPRAGPTQKIIALK